MDCTVTMEIKMREKAALALAGVSDKETFVDSASKGALDFPVLCSLRKAIRKRIRKPDEMKARRQMKVLEKIWMQSSWKQPDNT